MTRDTVMPVLEGNVGACWQLQSDSEVRVPCRANGMMTASQRMTGQMRRMMLRPWTQQTPSCTLQTPCALSKRSIPPGFRFGLACCVSLCPLTGLLQA